MKKIRYRNVLWSAIVLALLIGLFILPFVSPGISTSNAASNEVVTTAMDSRTQVRDYYFPGTEPIKADEMRVIALGTGMPLANKGQAAASFLVQLGNGENFIFDIGTNAFTNLTSLEIPWHTLDKVFLGHLHFDHMGDLSALLIAGVSHGRNTPLNIWGPSGASPDLGTKYSIEHLLKAYRWEFASKQGKVPPDGYRAVVTEFDYSKTQTIYEQNGVVIKSWPAIHAIDGPVSFSLEWQGLKFVYSSDTYPNKWFLENAVGADILIHEAFPTVQQLIDNYRMVPESAWPVGTRIHTQPAAAGKIFSLLKPRMAVAFHFVGTPQTRQQIFSEIRTTYDGPVTIGQDLLVWNVDSSHVSVRQAVVPEVVWPTPSKRRNVNIDTSSRIFPSAWLQKGRLDMSDVDKSIWDRLDPATRQRVIERLPEMRAPKP